MTTITITFERMPGIPRKTILSFHRLEKAGKLVEAYPYRCYECDKNTMIVFRNYRREKDFKAVCHPSDTFSWEIGMRLCVKRIGNPALYRAFLRWMWLKKAAHECSTVPPEIGCSQYCSMYDKCGETFPLDKIAREFGRVEVTIT